jgi:hypothetical protein
MGSLFPMFSRLGLCVGVNFFVMANGIVEFGGGFFLVFLIYSRFVPIRFPMCSLRRSH